MGGHAAWKKRVANGELAKGAGGAICRHHPHRGRKGKDLILNRKGFIGKGNPKKQKHRSSTIIISKSNDGDDDVETLSNKEEKQPKQSLEQQQRRMIGLIVCLLPAASAVCYLIAYMRR